MPVAAPGRQVMSGVSQPGQLVRLDHLRAQHPDVVIKQHTSFGYWEAWIPVSNGGTVIARYVCRTCWTSSMSCSAPNAARPGETQMNDQHTAPADLVRQLADPPSMTCYQGRDHRAGTDSGCPAGGQLTAACARRPCPAVRRLPAGRMPVFYNAASAMPKGGALQQHG